MHDHGIWRRLVGIAVVASVLVFTACTDAADPVEPGLLAFSHGSSSMTPEFEQRLAELRRTTAPFHNVDKAMAAGYDVQLTPCWYFSGQGAMGYHYGNVGLIDGTPELLAPEILVYEPKRDGSLRLVAMEYIVPIAAWSGESPPMMLGQEYNRNEALGLYALHVWLWRNNPSGMFADWNPMVSCEFAADSEDRAG